MVILFSSSAMYQELLSCALREGEGRHPINDSYYLLTNLHLVFYCQSQQLLAARMLARSTGKWLNCVSTACEALFLFFLPTTLAPTTSSSSSSSLSLSLYFLHTGAAVVVAAADAPLMMIID